MEWLAIAGGSLVAVVMLFYFLLKAIAHSLTDVIEYIIAALFRLF
jgi:hypothetical protein